MKELFNQISIFPCYKIKGDNKIFYSLQDAANELGVVTVNKNYFFTRAPNRTNAAKIIYNRRSVDLKRFGFFEEETLLQEIVSTTINVSEDLFSYFFKIPYLKEIKAEILASKLVEKLRTLIERNWDSEKLHVMLLSSGYDSRLITLILHELYLKKGKDGFGTCLFYTFEPEVSLAKKFFFQLSFPRNWFVPITFEEKEIDYYSDVINFSNVAKNHSEASRFFLGFVLINDYLRSQVGSKEDIIFISGLFGDETTRWNRRRMGDLSYLISYYFYDRPFYFLSENSRFFIPFISKDYLEVLTKFCVNIPVDDFKKKMISIVDSKFVNDINYRFLDNKYKNFNFSLISQKTLYEIQKNFLNSWYCATFKKKNIIPFSNILDPTDQKWKEYMKACIYENLLNIGCILK